MFQLEGPFDILYAQIDNQWAIQDYDPGQNCIRFIAVSDVSFKGQFFNTPRGCQTYIIDQGWDDFNHHARSLGSIYNGLATIQGTSEEDPGGGTDWISIRFVPCATHTVSYAYPAFADADPTYLTILDIYPVSGPPVLPLSVGTVATLSVP